MGRDLRSQAQLYPEVIPQENLCETLKKSDPSS